MICAIQSSSQYDEFFHIMNFSIFSLMIPITGETDCTFFNFLFLACTVLCYGSSHYTEISIGNTL